MTRRHVPKSRGRQQGRLDWAGAALTIVGLGGLVSGLILSSEAGWYDIRLACLLWLAALALAVFILQERRHPTPLLPLYLFRSRDFSGVNLLTVLLYATLGGSLYFLPLNLIQVQGHTAFEAGAALLPFVLTMSVLSGCSGALEDRHGSRRPLVFGSALAALGFGLFALPSTGGSYWEIGRASCRERV